MIDGEIGEAMQDFLQFDISGASKAYTRITPIRLVQ